MLSNKSFLRTLKLAMVSNLAMASRPMVRLTVARVVLRKSAGALGFIVEKVHSHLWLKWWGVR